jgi:hypothetical protein
MSPFSKSYHLIIAFLVVVMGGVFAASANASQLIDRNTYNVHLRVNNAGIAMLTYKKHGTAKTFHVLARGAINARPPVRGTTQVKFKLDRAGGWGFFHKADYWKTFKNVCGPYKGPKLTWLVAACTMPDGSNWAVQSWKRMLSNYGLPSTGTRNGWELRLSHWNTPDVPVLTINVDWSWHGRFDHLWGFYTYMNQPVFGFVWTHKGVPLDGFGRNVYVDTYNSAYGPGWKRENSFLTHPTKGGFCYGFSPHRKSGITGKGQKYRATVEGPGVAPDAFWEGVAPGPYDEALDATLNQEQVQELGNDPRCNIN